MPADKETMTLSCDECGADQIITPDDHNESSVITCNACGVAHGKWADIKEEFTKMFAKSAQGIIGDDLSNLKSTKFTKFDI